jgi:hypothetical protein
MSCEVICCEVPELLQKLVEEREGQWLDFLFEFLQQSEELDCYLAGYFEKILEMLFRKMTSQMMVYLNRKGVPLFNQFLFHIRNYSIMQIVQRLMLPHLPFTSPETEMLNFEDNRDVEQCNWSFLPEVCESLLSVMLQPNHCDEPLHVSDMLITVVQLSPPETLLIKFLCEAESVRSLLLAATAQADSEATGESLTQTNSEQQQVSLAAASVLESLVSRLFESGFPLMNLSALDASQDNNNSNSGAADSTNSSSEAAAAEQEQLQQVHELLRSICDEVAPLLDRVAAFLLQLLKRAQRVKQALQQQRTEEEALLDCVRMQSKMRLPRLGHLGLQMVKLVEALVRVGSFKIDAACRDSGLLAVCLRLFLAFDFHSVLHLSVQRIFVTVFEAPVSRALLQRHLCRECGLLQVLMTRVGIDFLPSQPAASAPSSATVSSIPLLSGLSEIDGSEENWALVSDHQNFRFSARHSSLAGHLVLIAHAAFLLLAGRDPIADEDFDTDDNVPPAGALHSENLDTSAASNDKSERLLRAMHVRRLLAEAEASESNAEPAEDSNKRNEEEIATCGLLQRWDEFVEQRFKKVLEHQLLSGALANTSDLQSTNTSMENVTSVAANSNSHANGNLNGDFHFHGHHLAHGQQEDVLYDERFEDEDFEHDDDVPHHLQHHFSSNSGGGTGNNNAHRGFDQTHLFGNSGGNTNHFQQHLAQFTGTSSMFQHHHAHPHSATSVEFHPFDDDFDDTDVTHSVHPHHPDFDGTSKARRGSGEAMHHEPIVEEDDNLAAHFSEEDPFEDSVDPATPALTQTQESPAVIFEPQFDAFADFGNFPSDVNSGSGGTVDGHVDNTEDEVFPPAPPSSEAVSEDGF